MKVFLTGASGILGSDINTIFSSANHEVLGFNSKTIDITSYHDVQTKMLDFGPHIVIHSAAMTNVDQCEVDRELALKVNALGAQNLSRSAAKANAKIIYISSCGVYGNEKLTPHTELDKTNPLNFHHFTKLEGENRVKLHNKDFLIVRPGWLFGGTTSHKKNFVEARRKEALENHELLSAVDKFGSPTYTSDVANQILRLIGDDLSGTFNIVNEGRASRYDYVSEIVKQFEFPTILKGVNSNLFPRKAIMPDNECLENQELNLNNINIMRDWRVALKEYINNTY